ncbi:MAG: hypothetical protein KJ000_33945 [Pirellulaceae bacterium]|nr:hypothetical protein [Pirellulaceae bacterium]
MMLHPVQRRVQEVNRRVRRATSVYALAASLLLVVSVVFLIGLLDYVVRFEDFGIRLIGSGLVFVAVIWSVRRWLWPGLGYRPSDLQIAQWIEQRFPELQNRLSSGLAFVGQSEHDAIAGSADLRRAVVAQATGDIESLDVDGCVDLRQPWRTALAAGAVCLLVAVFCVLDPASAGLAARRLAMPWQSAPWPRRHQLVFVDPPVRLAAGSDFEVELFDGRGELPDAVQIHYWFDGAAESEIQTKNMNRLNDRMVHRLENVQLSFRYRASGGDDTAMAWRHLEVVEPPRIEELKLHLHPPAYTGWPVESSGENVVALQGTKIAVIGRVDQPVSAVDLRVAEEQREEEKTWNAKVGGDGLTFALSANDSAPWIVEASGRYWFEVTDPEGLRGRGDRAWNLRVVPDAAPVVTLEKPGANTFVMATAVVPVRATVKDDLALQSVAIGYRRGDQPESDEQGFELYRGPDKPPAAANGGLRFASELGDSRPIESTWDLSRIADLQPGTWIELWMVAEDYKPQSGQSSVRRLTIISAEELDERLAARQAFILGQLNEILRLQQETRAQTKQIEIELEVAGELDKQDVDQLQSAELNQRQVGRNLTDPTDGVAAQITAVLDELATNRVDNPETLRRMSELLGAVNQIGQQHLPEIQRQLVSSLRLARSAVPSDDSGGIDSATGELRQSLSSVGGGQDQVIAMLENLLGDLSQWDNYRRFAREISRIRREQQTITEQTDQLRLNTLGQRPEDLSPQDKAALKRQSERQSELARRLDKTLGRMDQMRAELTDTEPLAAEMLADAVHLARQAAISGRMREGGRQIEENQVGQAVDTQRHVENDLADLLDALANRREQELGRRAQGLDEAQRQIEQLRRNLETLRQQLEQNQQTTDADARRRELERLARQAEALGDEAKRLERRLQRLQAEKTAESLEQAASHLQQAAQAGQEGQAAETMQHTKEAEQALEQAQQRLQAQRQKLEKDLFQETMARLEQQITALVRRQQGLLDTAIDLELARGDSESPFSKAQLTSLRDLAQAQRVLSAETTRLAEQVVQSRVFALGLRGAATEMDYAARAIDRQQTGATTERHQRNAMARLGNLIEALKKDAPSQDPPPEAPPSGQTPPEQAGEDAIQKLAELKLLRTMQIEVNRQTAELGDVVQKGGSEAEAALRRMDELAAEQGRLADLMLELSQESVERPEDDPERLPDTSDLPILEQ